MNVCVPHRPEVWEQEAKLTVQEPILKIYGIRDTPRAQDGVEYEHFGSRPLVSGNL